MRRARLPSLAAVRSLLDKPAFSFEDRDAVGAAADLYAQETCGFSDCLIAAKHQRMGCELTAAFARLAQPALF